VVAASAAQNAASVVQSSTKDLTAKVLSHVFLNACLLTWNSGCGGVKAF
jgi:hypothetical protein